jgi:hypothetical protein
MQGIIGMVSIESLHSNGRPHWSCSIMFKTRFSGGNSSSTALGASRGPNVSSSREWPDGWLVILRRQVAPLIGSRSQRSVEDPRDPYFLCRLQ